MNNERRIAVVIGSLRKESINRKLALTLMNLAPTTLKATIVEIGKLPLYNEDEDSSPPATWTEFRAAIRAHDAVLFVTPEYNRSVPGVLKNALDVGSRPYGQSVWNGKPCAIVTASPGAIGGFGANHHLRQSLVFLNMPTLQQPEIYLSKADKLFDESGVLSNKETTQFLKTMMESFAHWINNTLPT